mgnify:FL=1
MKYFFIFLVFLINSCVSVHAPSGPGLLYTDSSEIVFYDPYVIPRQKAMLCAKNILGLFSYGQNSIDELKRKSAIRKISSIEKTYYSRFFVYGKSCTIIKGE